MSDVAVDLAEPFSECGSFYNQKVFQHLTPRHGRIVRVVCGSVGWDLLRFTWKTSTKVAVHQNSLRKYSQPDFCISRVQHMPRNRGPAANFHIL